MQKMMDGVGMSSNSSLVSLVHIVAWVWKFMNSSTHWPTAAPMQISAIADFNPEITIEQNCPYKLGISCN